MLAGMIAGATLVVVLLLLAQLGQEWGRRRRGVVVSSAAGLAIAGAVLATVLAMPGSDATARGNERFGSSALSWSDVDRVSSGLRPPVAEAAPRVQVASVPSLITGLEQRLEANPADDRGWALLAQSYAFVGETERAEQAVLRAVALGFDEANLRERVASARPNPHAGLPGFEPAGR